MLAADDNAGSQCLPSGLFGTVGDLDVLDVHITHRGKGSHFAGNSSQMVDVAIDGGIGQVQVTDNAVAVQLAEQTGFQITDGVTAALVVALEYGAWLGTVMAEALCLQIVGISRVTGLTDFA